MTKQGGGLSAGTHDDEPAPVSHCNGITPPEMSLVQPPGMSLVQPPGTSVKPIEFVAPQPTMSVQPIDPVVSQPAMSLVQPPGTSLVQPPGMSVKPIEFVAPQPAMSVQPIDPVVSQPAMSVQPIEPTALPTISLCDEPLKNNTDYTKSTMSDDVKSSSSIVTSTPGDLPAVKELSLQTQQYSDAPSTHVTGNCHDVAMVPRVELAEEVSTREGEADRMVTSQSGFEESSNEGPINSENEASEVIKSESDVAETVKAESVEMDSEKENTVDPNEVPIVEPVVVKEELNDEAFGYYETEFQPKVIKLVNTKGEPFMCQTCSYQSRHLRWLRHHEKICQRQGPPANPMSTIPKGTLIFARPAGLAQQLMIPPDLVKLGYPAQTVRLIGPQLGSSNTAELIAGSPIANNMAVPQIVTPLNVARFVTPKTVSATTAANQAIVAASSTQNPLQCSLCSFVAVSKMVLDLHVKNNHAPVYSCNYCTFKTKQQDEIRTHLDCHCTVRPQKVYTCLICTHEIYAVEDIEKHFRDKHPKYQISAGNIPVRMGYKAPQPLNMVSSPQLVRRPTVALTTQPPVGLQPMMMTPSRQKDIMDGFHLCRYCPFKSKKPSELNDHMKFSHSMNTFDFDKKTETAGQAVRKFQRPTVPGKIDLRTSVDAGNFDSLEFLPPDTSPTFTASTVIGRPKCASKRRQDMSYVIQDKIDNIKCSPKEKNFSCEFCDFKTTTTFNLKRHIKNRHKGEVPTLELKEDNSVQCQYCGDKMTLGSLKRHIRSKHPEMIEAPAPTVLCPYCEFGTNTSHNLRRHVHKRHPEKLKDLRTTPHKAGVANLYIHRCHQCEFVTDDTSILEAHVNDIHVKLPLAAASGKGNQAEDSSTAPAQVPGSPAPGSSPISPQTSGQTSASNVQPSVKLVSDPPQQTETKPAMPHVGLKPTNDQTSKSTPLVVTCIEQLTPAKDPKLPREKTLSCKHCEFKTAYTQNLRRHYEKTHKDVYPLLYPERYARDAKKALAHSECKTDLLKSESLTVVSPPTVIQATSRQQFISENNSTAHSSPVTITTSLPAASASVSNMSNIRPANHFTQSVGQCTSNTFVNTVQVSSKPATLIYRPAHPSSTTLHNTHSIIRPNNSSSINQPGSSAKLVPLVSQSCETPFSDQNKVTAVLRDKL